jgi:hypothetical protein
MVHPLVGIHAFLGEAGIFAFVWVLVELLNPTPKRVSRAKFAAVLGVLLFLASWWAGGYYYVEYYGPEVKPLIKEGPEPYAHSIFTEVKEHIFLFLPFLSILFTGLLFQYHHLLLEHRDAKIAFLLLASLIIATGFAMAGFGYLISSGARAALEAGT